MDSTAGTGVLLSDGKELPVGYDLVKMPSQGNAPTEGQVFGDVDDLRAAYAVGRCGLRLENGNVIQGVILGVSSRGVAEIRITRLTESA